MCLPASSKALEVDEAAIRDALDSGRARHPVMEQCREAGDGAVKGSPHVFLPDAWDVHNPGIELEWHGEHGEGFPVVKSDDPSVYEEIFERVVARA